MARPLRRLALAALASALSLVVGPSPAYADARDVAARVAAEWRSSGAKVTVLPTRFLFDDDRQVVAIPPPDAKGEGKARSCTHVALVAARGLSFRAKLDGAPVDPLVAPEHAGRAASSAGMARLVRCEDDETSVVRTVEITSDAGRGAVEVVVAHGPELLPDLTAVVPERTGGVLPPVPDAGVLAALPLQDRRVEAAEQRARRDGATGAPRRRVRSAEDGSGEVEFELPAGCHRIEVIAPQRVDRLGRRYRLDLDAELRSGERVVARDRTEAPDARLETCVATSSPFTVVYAGAPPVSDVLVAQASWPLPARLPSLWGGAPRGRMARVMFLRHVAMPSEDPILLAQGSSGITPVPVSVEVGGCYVAVVAVTHGRARQLQLRAHVGARESADERGATEEAALSAFCVRADEKARLEVLARPSGVAWGLALYRVKSGVWEVTP